MKRKKKPLGHATADFGDQAPGKRRRLILDRHSLPDVCREMFAVERHALRAVADRRRNGVTPPHDGANSIVDVPTDDVLNAFPRQLGKRASVRGKITIERNPLANRTIRLN